MNWTDEKIHVNVPFIALHESYLDRFIQHRLNPEIAFDSTALDRYSHSDFSAVAKQLHEHGLAVTFHAPFMDMAPGSTDPMIREVTRNRFEQVLELIPLFRPKTVVCHAGYDERRYHHIRDVWTEKSLEMWAWLGKRMQDEGTRLMLENVFEQGPDDIRILLEQIGNQTVGFCLDTGHKEVFSHADFETWVESLGPFLGELHLHDNRGKRDEHLAMGQGIIDFGILFEKLKAMKKEPPIITLEQHREEDLWPSFEYLKKIWPW